MKSLRNIKHSVDTWSVKNTTHVCVKVYMVIFSNYKNITIKIVIKEMEV